MATIAMVDFDFDDCDFERDMAEAAGIRFTSFNHRRNCTADEIIAHGAGADGVITSYGRFTAEVIGALPSLKVISKTGTGVDNIDIAAATANGTVVCNVPGYGTSSVAQFAIALLLEICCRAGHHDQAVHQGRWAACPDYCFWDYPLVELAGKTMGIVGFGSIGQAVGRIAGALGMEVIATGPRPWAAGSRPAPWDPLEELLGRSDVVSLHCPLFPETRGLINRETIALMKDGAILLNNSRGPLIVERDVACALNSGKLFAAGVDVADAEPIPADSPLLTAKNCIITPHISWAPRESRQRIMDCTAENISAFFRGTPVNVVNS